MTYNQLVQSIQTTLSNHPMIHDVRFATPIEWINWQSEPTLPVALFMCSTGSFELGRQLSYSVQFWFLDKSGSEGEFETDIISDQHQIANDVISNLRKNMNLSIDDSITWNAISEKFEDYLSGVELTLNIQYVDKNNNCEFPS